MKINKNVILHFTMAITAVLVLVLPPMIDGANPSLKFMPMIKTMDGNYKEQNEKIATISHALQGNAIFFLGASEVSWSTKEPYAVYNFFNEKLNIPVVAYGSGWVENIIQYSLLTRFKSDLTDKTKLVLLISPDSFYTSNLSPAVFEKHITGKVYEPLIHDSELSDILRRYLSGINFNEVDYMPIRQLNTAGGGYKEYYKYIEHEFSLYCDLVKGFYFSIGRNERKNLWPKNEKLMQKLNWGVELDHAKQLGVKSKIAPETNWMEPFFYYKEKGRREWSNELVNSDQVLTFKLMLKMLHDRHVQLIAIIDPLNPWAIAHTDRFKPTDAMIIKTLKQYNIPYLDMYDKKYKNGWNRDQTHPSDLAWVDIDHFIYENLK